MTTHDIPALEAAYRDACVKAFECPPGSPESHDARYEAQRASDALQRAKAASEDDGVICKIIRDAAASCGGHVYDREADAILAALRSAGYRVTKEQQP